MFFRSLLCFVLCSYALLAETIETFYGPIDVHEPILLDLIHSPAMQRLKEIHQYGVAYYAQTHPENYHRYDHSIGVFAILRKNGASLEEQISGLLHDVSHTVFSHVGDWIFGKQYQEDDYQTIIFRIYLSYSGIEEILMKHGYTSHQVPPKANEYRMLEQNLPNLCADRIDYNIQGAYHQGFLTKEEAVELYENFRYVEGRWVATKIDLLKKLALFSIFMTRDCWGSPGNYAASCWLADAILKAIDIGLLSWKEIHWGIDEDVWNKLLFSEDPFIKQMMHKLANLQDTYREVEPSQAHVIVKFRCRAIDPWVLSEGTVVQLSSLDPTFAFEYKTLQQKAKEGWSLQLY